jgi:hypothetical protein
MGQVVSNKNTTQAPIVGPGLTGTQVKFFIPAGRFYIKALDTTPSAPVGKSFGKTPTGWTDLGMMMDQGTVNYSKDIIKLKSGTDKVLQSAYVGEKTGTFECVLGQYDDIVLQNVTGLTPSTIQANSIVRFNIGAEALVQKAVLLVSQNKTDGKEIQYYSPNAFITFSIDQQDGAQVVKLTADLPLFTMDTVDQLFSETVFHADLPTAY